MYCTPLTESVKWVVFSILGLPAFTFFLKFKQIKKTTTTTTTKQKKKTKKNNNSILIKDSVQFYLVST